MKADTQDTIIIGAGIIGIACAAYLAEAGRSVMVIDRTGICEETSSGNAAAFAFSDVLPLAPAANIMLCEQSPSVVPIAPAAINA